MQTVSSGDMLASTLKTSTEPVLTGPRPRAVWAPHRRHLLRTSSRPWSPLGEPRRSCAVQEEAESPPIVVRDPWLHNRDRAPRTTLARSPHPRGRSLHTAALGSNELSALLEACFRRSTTRVAAHRPASAGNQKSSLSVGSPPGLATGILRLRLRMTRGGNRMWIATGGGVCVVEGNTWTTYTETDGLAHHIVNAVAVDGAGHVWLGTEAGPNELAPW